MPMVASDELDDFIPSGIAACQTQCTHRRLGSRVDHADGFNGWIDRLNELSQLRLHERRCTIARPARHSLLQSLHHLRMRVPDDHRPP